MKSSLPTVLGSVPLIPDDFIQKQLYIHKCIDQQLPEEQRTRNGFSIVCQNCTHRRSRNHTMIPPKFAIALGAWTAYLIELRNCGMPPFSPSPLQLFSVMVWYKPGRVAEIFCSAIYPRAFFLGGVFFFCEVFWVELRTRKSLNWHLTQCTPEPKTTAPCMTTSDPLAT